MATDTSKIKRDIAGLSVRRNGDRALASISTQTVLAFLKQSNTAQLGSFGEALFQVVCKKLRLPIRPHFRERTDFIVDNRRYDIKTTKMFLEMPSSNGRVSVSRTQRAAGVRYVSVQFSRQGVLIVSEDGLLNRSKGGRSQKHSSVIMPWSEAEKVYCQWRHGDLGRKHVERRVAAQGLPGELKARIFEIFQNHELESPYILYRTNMFKAESPHNLLPSERSAKQQLGWTVFLIFDTITADTNLEMIIAFPDSAAQKFPRLKKKRLGNVRKIDVNLIPQRYICKKANGKDILTELDARLPMP